MTTGHAESASQVGQCPQELGQTSDGGQRRSPAAWSTPGRGRQRPRLPSFRQVLLAPCPVFTPPPGALTPAPAPSPGMENSEVVPVS